MNDAMRNAFDDCAAQMASTASNAACMGNTCVPRPLGVREIVRNNSEAIKEILVHADRLMEIVRGPENCECCDGKRVADEIGLLTEVQRQSQDLDCLNGRLLAVIELLLG